MKKLIVSLCAFAALLACEPNASALVYTNSDLLLVFHQDGYNDVTFDIGSVSNYLNLPSGTVVAVTGFDTNLLAANYSPYSLAEFVLMSATEFQVGGNLPKDADWLTCSDTSTPLDVSGSTLATQNGIINSIGDNAAANTFDSLTNSYVSATYPTATVGGYTYDVTGGSTGGDEETLDGTAAFAVEQSVPGTSRFFQIGVNDDGSIPVLATQIGSFSMDTNGGLTFIAGAVEVPPPAPAITVASVGGVNTISFTSIAGPHYRLLYSSDLSIPVANWAVAGSSVAGNGSLQTLQDTTGSSRRYYVVEAYY
ncbi:MAG TPA: hypothetical protein VH619_15250 [Verrucomicrobiae bacterium]|jgi:hypothetical protein|nr:hypothetical protein [Verrucomicrobiae bacterium]